MKIIFAYIHTDIHTYIFTIDGKFGFACSYMKLSTTTTRTQNELQKRKPRILSCPRRIYKSTGTKVD